MTESGERTTAVSSGLAHLAREAGAGISAAFVLVAIMLPLGLIAFEPICEERAIEAGLSTALACALFGNLTALVLPGPLLPNEVPRASSVFLFAAFILSVAGDPTLCDSPAEGMVAIFFLAAMCVALTGGIQILFGVLRLGNIARFVPYPVVAGLMTGIAISLVIYELPEVLGTHGAGHGGGGLACAGPACGDLEHGAHAIGGHGAEGHGDHHGVNLWTILIGLVTISGFVLVRRRWPALPSKLIGLAAGTALAVVITFVLHGDVGPRVPFLGHVPLPDALLPLPAGDGLALALRLAHEHNLLLTAFLIAVVGSLDSLLAAIGEGDGPLDTAHNPNRLLVALGCGNLVSSLFGGVPVAYSSHHAMEVQRHRDRRLVSSLATTATLIVLLLYGAPLLNLIPMAALAAMMLVIAVGLINRWASVTLDRVRRGQYDRELLVNVALVAVVAVVTIVYQPVAGVITGLVLSLALFVAVMNRSLIRSVRTRATRGSRRVYPPAQADLLRAEGHRIKVIELDGAIFFGTADRLASEAVRAAEGVQYLILDLRRVTMIDASGALVLQKLKRLLQGRGVTLLLAHLSANSRLGRGIQGAGVFTERHHPDWFDDADGALEWAEQQLLEQAQATISGGEIAIGEFALFEGLAADELELMKPYLDRQPFPAHAALYREGELGDRLYLLARGAVRIVVEDPGIPGKHRRVVTLAPGVIFGESAMIEGGSRSVTAIAQTEVVTYSLSRDNLERIYERNPDLYRRVVLNMVGHLSGLLGMTTGILRDTSESVDAEVAG